MRGSSLQMIELSKSFGDQLAVDSLTLEIEPGEFFSLMGPSGCGKTTTLRMVAGLESPSSGSILLGGRDVTDTPAYRRSVNTVFQQYALFPHLNAGENIAFGLRERGVSKREAAPRIAEMLELVDLPGRERALPSELSGGQQQRVALARALVLEPEVLLLDEPLAALDFHLRRQMQDALKDIHREVGVTFVLVTHDQEEAFSMADRVGVMHAGRIEQVGKPSEVYHRPSTITVATLVGASNRFSAEVSSEPAPGEYELSLDGLAGTLMAAGAPGLGQGAAVELILRPEGVRLYAEGEAPAPAAEGGALLPGTVEDSSYLGSQIRYRVDCPGLGSIVAVSVSTVGTGLSRGDRVGVAWARSAAWALGVAGKA